MSRAIRKAREFTVDFENVFSWYIDKAGLELASRFQGALDNSLIKLSIQPDLGRLRHFRHPKLQGLRSLQVEHPFENLLIFYHATDNTLDVIRLMHGARHLPRRLIESPS
ncbi:MAG TPA: type II toxin-antitoxin system RelE/ParE family toxin [Verrucomicrobiae bacterium]|jgi:plasmid stabilization system protein ParE